MVKWHGDLRPHPRRPGDFNLDVLFSTTGNSEERAIDSFARVGDKKGNAVHSWPLHLLPLVPIGSLWKRNERCGVVNASRQEFDVCVREAGATLVDPMASKRVEVSNGPPDGKVRPEFTTHYEIPPYKLGGLANLERRAPLWRLGSSQGTELLVPQAEIHRVYYFYCPEVTRPLISGALDYQSPLTLAPQRLFVEADTGFDEHGVACLRVARGISMAQGKPIARFVFDEVGKQRAALIHRRLVANGSTSTRGMPFDVGTLPAVLPPFDGTVRWEVEGIPLIPGERLGDPPKRFLVTRILVCRAPPPVPKLVLWLATDNRKGINAGDPNLRPAFSVPVKAAEDGLAQGEPSDFEDEDPNAGLQPKDVDASLPFQAGLEEMDLEEPSKHYQVSQHVGAVRPEVSVPSGIGLGHSHWNDQPLQTVHIKGEAEHEVENRPAVEIPLGESIVRFVDFRSACKLVPAVMEAVYLIGNVTHIDLPSPYSAYVFPKGQSAWSLSWSGTLRRYIVAEFRVGDRFVYAFEAETFQNEAMSLLLIRNAGFTRFNALAIGRIAKSCVDANTSGWLTEAPENFYFRDVRHPTGCAGRRAAITPLQVYTGSFAVRIASAIDALLSGRSGRSRRRAAKLKGRQFEPIV